MRKPLEDIRIFKQRRDLLKLQLSSSHQSTGVNSAVILTSYPEVIRNHDVGHPYRQDSNLYYLTGFEEPETIFIFRPGLTPETVIFVRPKNIERETWDGFRFGPQGTEEQFGIDKAYTIDEFNSVAPQLLKQVDQVYYRLFKNVHVDRMMEQALIDVKAAQGRTGYGLLPILDAESLLGEMRVIKSAYEIELQRKACEISAKAHLEAMKFSRPGVTERQIQGVLAYQFYMNGASREGYNYIVASGSNATTLHYNFNDQVCKDGDLLLIDAGAEYNFFTGDITRTYPVNGKFTDEQALVYEGVLNVQRQLIENVKPGVPFKQFHDMAADLLTDLMLSLGLLSGKKEAIISANGHRKYYPHGMGHYLGMDVHDAGFYFVKGQPRPIEENMCFTIEPGLYIPIDDRNAPEKFRGIGVRIEDNIRVTSSGCEVMTSMAPKEIADLEKVIGQQSR